MSEDSNNTVVWVPEPQMVDKVIGKHGQTIRRLIKETSTYIYHKEIDGKHYFIIKGNSRHHLLAKLKVKELISNGLILATAQKGLRFPFICSRDSTFVLQAANINSTEFKIVSKNQSNKAEDSVETGEYSAFTHPILRVLTSIYEENKKNGLVTNIWSTFGHFFVTNIKKEEEQSEFSFQELSSRLLESNIARKWQLKFAGVIDGGKPINLEEWMHSRSEKRPLLGLYKFMFYTPSCRVFELKIFTKADCDSNPDSLVLQNIPNCEPLANIIRKSDSYPYLYLCESTVRRATVNVFQPDEEIDHRFIIESGSPSSPQDSTGDEEGDVLFKFIQENIEIDSDVPLPVDKLPKDFELFYIHILKTRIYPLTSENEEPFTVKISHVKSFEISKGMPNETTVDIQLQCDEWNKMLEEGTWDPQKIVDKLPEFMECAKCLARTLKAQEPTKLIPPEIQVLGAKGRVAYEHALKSGYTKNRRILIMLIGQSRAGKTSLFKSLQGKLFNSQEDSTEGVSVHRFFCKAEENLWSEDMPSEDVFCLQAQARAMADYLKKASGPNLQGVPVTQRSEEDPFQRNLDVEEGENQEQKDQEKRPFSIVKDFDGEKKGSADSEPYVNMPPEPTLELEVPEGITEVVSNILKHPDNEEENNLIYSITLDFAGQPVYQATHPVFLSPNGIYILIHSLNNEVHAQATPMVRQGSVKRKVDDKCPMTNMDHLEFWLSFVSSLWDSEDVSHENQLQTLDLKQSEGIPSEIREFDAGKTKTKLPNRLPPVFLVGTHADKPFNDGDPTEMTREILKYLREGGRAKDGPGDHVVRAVYAVDNTVSGTSEEDNCVKKLRSRICQVAKSLPHMNEYIPIRWLHFEKELLKLVEREKKKHISLEEAKNVALKCQISSDKDEFDTVLKYLHNLNIVIYFEDTNIVIIDTQWLLDMIVQVITVQPYEEWDDQYEDMWEKLENNGILDQALIDHVWKNEVTANSLIMIMERFSLLCRWKRSDGPDIFLVPSMLMNSDPIEANALLSDPKTSKTLVVRFKGTHLPLGIFPRLLVIIAKTCNEKWPESPQPKFYHNFCRFYNIGGENGKGFDLVVTSDVKTVTFSVINERGIMRTPLTELCRFLVELLTKKLEEMRINFPWMKNIKFEFCIRCPVCDLSLKPCDFHNVVRCKRDSCVHLIMKDDLNENQPRCYMNDTKKVTFIEKEAYSDWFIPKLENKDSDSLKMPQLLPLDSSPSTTEGTHCNQLVPYGSSEVSLLSNSVVTEAKFKDLIGILTPYKTSMEDPPAEVSGFCRSVCRQLKGVDREKQIIEARMNLPSGMTGPKQDEHKLYEDMDLKERQKLTRELCDENMWKMIAGQFGVSGLDYYARKPNPVQGLLEDVCKKKNLTMGELYDVLVKCDANAIADRYL